MHLLDKQRIFESLQSDDFVCTFSGHSRTDRDEASLPQRIVVRSVGQGEDAQIQLNTFTVKQHFVSNFPHTAQGLNAALDQCMAGRFMQVHIQRPDFDFYLRRTASGMSAKRTKASRQDWSRAHEHNQQRNYLVTEQNSAELLRALRITNEKGQIIPAMMAKYRQINHFLAMVFQDDRASRPILRVVDCGCGRAYLSLSLYHVVSNLMKQQVELVGIDNNPELVQQCERMAKDLGYERARFVCCTIAEADTDTVAAVSGEVDIVIALHACDTATDDALALALRHKAKTILAAPCCHHYVNERLRSSEAPASMSALLRDGIARERFSDLLTDTMRRDIVRSFGYSAELVEFVAQEHTMKNIMIRAHKVSMPTAQQEQLRKAVQQSFEEWHVAPKLSDLVGLS